MEGSGSAYRPLTEQQQPEGTYTQPQYPSQQQYGVYQQQPVYGAYPYQPQPYGGQFAAGQVYVQPSPFVYAPTRAPARVRFAVSIILLIIVAVMLGAPGWYAANTYSYDDYDTSLATVGVWQGCVDGNCYSVCDGTTTADSCWKFQAMRATMIIALVVLLVDIALLRAAAKGAEYPAEGRRNGAAMAFLTFALIVATLGFAGDLLNDVGGFRPYYCFYFNITSMFLTISSMILAFRIRRIM